MNIPYLSVKMYFINIMIHFISIWKKILNLLNFKTHLSVTFIGPDQIISQAWNGPHAGCFPPLHKTHHSAI